MKKTFEPVEGRNAEIINAITSCPEMADIPENVRFKVNLCVEEIEENILTYSGTRWVEVCVERTDEKLEITFRDGGIEFNPLEKEDPDINAGIEERQIGGLGIFLCKQMMDEVHYDFIDKTNILSIVKYL